MGQLNDLYVSSSYQGLLKMTDSTNGLTNTLQTVQTGDGDNSPLQMSLTQVNISGSFTVNNFPITGSTSGTSGTSGSSGSSGTNGSSGSSGTSGTGFSVKGAWTGTTNYIVGDVVYYNGSSYVAIQNNINRQPSVEPAYWQLFSAAGSNGTSGTAGTSGTSGSNGSSGTSGSNGSSGTAGTSGSSGSNGSSGTSGSNGSSGTSGSSGSSGSNGSSGTSGSNGSSGTSGSNGTDGSSGSSGISGSSGTSGSNGSSGTSGSSGSNGSSGTSGSNGSSGTSGSSGSTGTSGTSGSSGSDGSSGSSGVNGTSGTSGTSGINGTSGTSGSDGSSGTAGTSGTSGSNGSSGTSGLSGLGLPSKVISTVGSNFTYIDYSYLTSGLSGSTQVVTFAQPFASADYSVDLIWEINTNFFYDSYFSLTSPSIDVTISGKTASGFTAIIWGQDVSPSGFYSGMTGYYNCIATGASNGSGIDGTSGTSGSNGSSGTSGNNGTSGTSGSSGVSNSFFNYQAKTNSQSGDPGSGYILWNNVTQTGATQINVSDNDQTGNNLDIFLGNLKSGSRITLQDKLNQGNYQVWDIGTSTDNTTYYVYPVTLVSATHQFSNNDEILFIITTTPSGTSGSSGTSGTSGSNGSSGTSGDSIFAQTGSFYATTNDIQITGSLTLLNNRLTVVSGGLNVNDVVSGAGTGDGITLTSDKSLTLNTHQNLDINLNAYTGSINLFANSSNKGVKIKGDINATNIVNSITGRTEIFGGDGVTGQTPRLYISGSDNGKTEIGRGFLTTDTTRVSALGAGASYYAAPDGYSYFNMGVYTPDTYVDDVEQYWVTTTGGTVFNDFDNVTVIGYVPWMSIDANLGNNPPPQMVRGLGVTGSLIAPQITGSLQGTASFAVTASYALNATGGDRNGLITTGSIATTQNITGSVIISGSLNVITTAALQIGTGSGDEGGEILLVRPNTNSSITGSGITIDSYQNKLRIFEQGGAARGGYFDITTLAPGVGTNLAAGGSPFPFTGSAIITGSAIVTGSVQGNVNSLSISSNTASLNLNDSNFFTLQLVSGSNTRIEPSNIKAGQTVNILINTTGSATVSFPSSVKYSNSGSAYVPTATTGKDVITLVSFDNSSLYLAAIKNFIG